MTMTLADLLAPITPERFFAEYYDKQPLHIRGGAGKFAGVLSWRVINRLLDMTHVWSNTSLKLVLDGTPIPPDQFCTRAQNRDGAPVMQPDARLVQEWIKRGASAVMNDVDSLTPGLAGVSSALEDAGLGKSQANVYISWQSHKAFHTHYDTHDVWAVQVEGEKDWNIWEGRADYPIAHPAFRGQPQSHHDQARGKLREKVTVKAGDLLYLPRGWYHDALAEAPSSVHVAYGVSAPLGMDLMNMLVERVLYDSLFRQPLPRQDGSVPAQFALTTRLGQIGQRLSELSKDPKVVQVAQKFVADYRYRRGGYDLLAARGLGTSASATDGDAPAFKVMPDGAKLVRRGTEQLLKTASTSLPVTPPEAEAIGWVLARPDVTEAELAKAHPGTDAPALLKRLQDGGILVPA